MSGRRPRYTQVERGDGVLLRDFTETLKIINTDASINSFTTYYEPYITDLSAGDRYIGY
jgi:hypothetical protein